MGVLAHFAVWGILGLGLLAYFGPKNKTRKTVTIQNNFQLAYGLLAYFEFKIHKNLNLSSLQGLKSLTRKIHKSFWSMSSLWAKMSWYFHVSYYWCALKVLLSKSWLYFFFLIFWHTKIPPSFRRPRYWYWFFTYLFFLIICVF